MSASGAELLERSLELAEFASALDEVRRGRGRVVLVEAAAGMGKTSLLGAACAEAAEMGFACVRARAGDLERDFAYGCVRQLLEPVVAAAPAEQRRRLFAGAAELAEPLFRPADVGLDSPSPASSYSMLHGLYWLLNNLAEERPVALSIDDVHWADAESLRFLAYLTPRLDGLPVIVLAARRAAEGSAAVARLAVAPETTVLRPAPLSVEATATLCTERLGVPVDMGFAAACRQATGGNPFFLEALLREARERRVPPDASGADRVQRLGPASVAQAVLLRISGAHPEAMDLVRAVAVLGGGATHAEAARLAELSVEVAAPAADLLVGLGILTAMPSGLEFAHPIVREAVYADIGAQQRAIAHARAAQMLAAMGADDERVAAQLVESDPAGDPERVSFLRRVADGATARGAPAAAVAWLRRALVEPPLGPDRAEVLFELGSAELRVGRPGAHQHLAEAVELTREAALLARSVRQLANALTVSGDADAAVRAIESALAIVGPADRELGLLLEAEAASHALRAGRAARAAARERLQRRSDLGGSSPGERLVLACVANQRARESGSAAEAAAHLERALAGGQLLAERDLDIASPLYDVMVGLLATDAVELASACLDQTLTQAQATAAAPAVANLTCLRGWVAFRRGALALAEADARTTVELLSNHGIPLGIPFATGLLVQALIEAGDIRAAERSFTDAGLDTDVPPGLAKTFLLEARGLLRLAQGRSRQGLDDILEFGRRRERWSGANPLASRWRSHAALALADLGELDEARRRAADEVIRARRWGAATELGVALRVAAGVGAGSAQDLLREAVVVLEGSPARLEHTRALIDLGAGLRRNNRRSDARGPLQQGLRLAEQCGAHAEVERARTELRAAGGRSSDLGGIGVDRLTASERRVADLAAEGRSNPEIAQHLFVTRKTVETHLGRAYVKLNISGRAALGRALAEPTGDHR